MTPLPPAFVELFKDWLIKKFENCKFRVECHLFYHMGGSLFLLREKNFIICKRIGPGLEDTLEAQV